MTFLYEHLDGTGRAEVAYARIVSRRHRIDLRAALTIARDVLAGESNETCEALYVLLSDGWDSALGEALAAARRV